MSVQRTPPFTRSQTGLTTSHSSTNDENTSDHSNADLQSFAPAPTQLAAAHTVTSVETAEQRNQRFEIEISKRKSTSAK